MSTQASRGSCSQTLRAKKAAAVAYVGTKQSISDSTLRERSEEKSQRHCLEGAAMTLQQMGKGEMSQAEGALSEKGRCVLAKRLMSQNGTSILHTFVIRLLKISGRSLALNASLPHPTLTL